MRLLSKQSSGLTLTLVLAVSLGLAPGLTSQVFAQAQPAQPGQQGASQSQNHQAVGMYNLGLSAYQQGSLESAIIFFRRATDLDPNLSDAQYNLGVLYQSQRRAKEAIPRFQEVLRVKPADPDAHYQLGLALMEMGRPAEAKTHFASIAPNNSHFADAQKRTQICDQQMAGATVATPSYTPASQTTPAMNINLNPMPAKEPETNNTVSSAGYQYNQQSYTPPAQQPQTYNPPAQQTYTPPAQTYTPPAQSQPAVAKTAPVASRNGAPTAVLANSSARVIATGFSAPSGLTFDRNGNLYVANFNSNTVDRISSDGTRMQFSSGANLKGPIGLVADDAGNLYVANYSSGTVARITPAGISTIIGTGFKQPYYLTLDKEGNLFVSQQEDNSVVRLTLPRAVVSR